MQQNRPIAASEGIAALQRTSSCNEGSIKLVPSVFTRILLYLSSYFPLTVIFFVLLLKKNRTVAIVVLSLGLVGLIGIALYLRTARQLNPTSVKVSSLLR